MSTSTRSFVAKGYSVFSLGMAQKKRTDIIRSANRLSSSEATFCPREDSFRIPQKESNHNGHQPFNRPSGTWLSFVFNKCSQDFVLGYCQASASRTPNQRFRSGRKIRPINAWSRCTIGAQYIRFLCSRFQLTISHTQPRHASTTSVSVIRAHQRYCRVNQTCAP